MSKCRKKEYSTVPQCPVWVYPSTTSLYVYAPGFFNQNSRVSKTKSSQNNQINLQCTFKTHPGYAEDVADSCGGTLVSDIFLKRVDFQLKIMSKMVRHWILLRLHHTLNCGYFWPGLPPWGHTLREPGSNFIELLSAQICLAWSFFFDKNRITNQISICCRLYCYWYSAVVCLTWQSRGNLVGNPVPHTGANYGARLTGFCFRFVYSLNEFRNV